MALEYELAVNQKEAPLVFPQVDEAVVASIVADWTGIPVGRMVTDEVAAVVTLQARLEARVIGQGARTRGDCGARGPRIIGAYYVARAAGNRGAGLSQRGELP